MNILFILFTGVPGGATKSAVSLMRGLSAKGHRIYAAAPDGGTLQDELEGSGVRLLYIPASLTVWPSYVAGGPFTKTLWLARRMAGWHRCSRQIYKIIKEYGIDIVHTNNGPVDLAPAACRRAGIPHIWHLREYQDKDFSLHFFPSKGSFRRKIFKENNFNIAITKGIFEHFSLREGIDIVIYNGIEICPTPEKATRVRSKTILFAGNITEGKCLHSLIRAFAVFLADHPGYRLQIAGRFDPSDSYCAGCLQEVENLRITGSVDWLGYRNDVQQLMQSTRIFCVPSRFEAFGRITAEAMGNGCIVVGRNTAGTAEQMDNALRWTSGEAAIRFNEDSTLADCLARAADEDLSEMISRARLAAQNYSVQKNVDAVEDFYKHILKDRQKV